MCWFVVGAGVDVGAGVGVVLLGCWFAVCGGAGAGAGGIVAGGIVAGCCARVAVDVLVFMLVCLGDGPVTIN